MQDISSAAITTAEQCVAACCANPKVPVCTYAGFNAAAKNRCIAGDWHKCSSCRRGGDTTFLVNFGPTPPGPTPGPPAPPSPSPPSPPGPMPIGCFVDDAHGPVQFKYSPGTLFPNEPNHGVKITRSAAQCCTLCKSFTNCTFWDYEHGGTAAQPTCYNQAGGCCFLKTDAAWPGQPGQPGVVSGSSKPLPPPPPPKALTCVYPHQPRFGLEACGLYNGGAGGYDAHAGVAMPAQYVRV
jgi:hypothetical protein